MPPYQLPQERRQYLVLGGGGKTAIFNANIHIFSFYLISMARRVQILPRWLSRGGGICTILGSRGVGIYPPCPNPPNDVPKLPIIKRK